MEHWKVISLSFLLSAGLNEASKGKKQHPPLPGSVLQQQAIGKGEPQASLIASDFDSFMGLCACDWVHLRQSDSALRGQSCRAFSASTSTGKGSAGIHRCNEPHHVPLIMPRCLSVFDSTYRLTSHFYFNYIGCEPL